MDATDAIDDRQSIVLVLVVVVLVVVVVVVVLVVRAEMTEFTEFALGLRGERGGRGGDVEGGGESKGEEEEEGEVPGPVWLLLSKCDGTPVGTDLPRSRRVVVSWGSRLPVVVVLMVAAMIVIFRCGLFDGRWGGRNERNDFGVIGAAWSLAMHMSEVGHRR